MTFWKKWNKEQKKDVMVPSWMPGIVIGIALLVLGAINDQFADIYRKAIRICLECIGIG